MAIGKIRAIIIIALFASSASIPILMETAVVPMLNLLNYINQFVTISTDEEGNPTALDLKFDVLLDKIKALECLEDESNENQTVLQLTLAVENTDPFEFDMLFPGLDLVIYWKAGLPYGREKDTILGWKNANLSSSNPHLEPQYDSRRWTRVMGVKIDATRIVPAEEKNIKIKIYLYNDEWVRGKSSALGQMIGTILRTQSTKDPYTNETLMHLSGAASLDIPGFNFGLDLDIGLDLSSFLNLTQLLGGMGSSSGSGSGGGDSNFFDLLFDVPLNILDIQNYNDSNGNFIRDYAGVDNQTHMKLWTENLYQNGALSAWIIMDLKDQLGMKNLNVTLLKSSHDPDDSDPSKVWIPEVGGAPIDKSLTANQLFLYLPDSIFLQNQNWANRIFGVMGFASDQRIYDYPERAKDLGDGQIITGGTLRLTGDLRPNASFTIGDSLGALMNQAIAGMLPIGVFGSIDLQLNEMPLSIALDLPLELNLTSLLSSLMGGEEPSAEGRGDLFSMLLDFFGLKSFLLNGIAFDTFNSLLQMNFTTNLDMFLPYGIYMPSEPEYDPLSGMYKPYIGIGGGPFQIFDASYPEDWENRTPQAQQAWHEEHLIMNLTSLDSAVFQESMAKLMATIGSSGYYDSATGNGGYGDGMAYVFEDDIQSNGDYGNLLQFLTANGELPNSEDHKSSFSFTTDQFMIDLKSFVPDFGKGLFTLADQLGIDPLFLEYLNNSIPHDNKKSIFEDLLSIKQLLNILSQDGLKNDIIDYLIDARIVYNETAVVLDKNTLQVAHDGVQRAISINNGTGGYSWNVNFATPLPNGKIYLDTSLTPVNDSFTKSGTIVVNYEANKLDLFDLSNLFGAILNLLFGSDESGGSSEAMSSFFTDIFTYLPGILDALGMDFDRILPDLVTYLRANLSQPLDLPKHQYGIKPFEMIDLTYHALFSTDTGGAGSTSDVITGEARDLIDNIIKELVAKFVEQADPFQLMHAAFNDLTPLMDYLNRSRIFSREVLIPLVASLFPSGGELATVEEEPVTLDAIVDILMPFITEMIVGGKDAHFDHEALNPFAWLTAPEGIVYQGAESYNDLIARGFSVYQVGTGNWTPDYPKYDYLRLMSNLTLGLLMSGFTAADLWALINQLGIVDLSGGGGSSSEMMASLKSLLALLGSFVPPTEWDSLLRELGIWSTWEGEFESFPINVWVDIPLFGWVWIVQNMDVSGTIGNMIDLEQLLATGQIMGREMVQLSLYENQSYGNPYSYIQGYDSAHDTGPYRQSLGLGRADNWGWVPNEWDPGGRYYSSVTGSSNPADGADYERSFLSRLISTIPVELDFDVLTIDPIAFEFPFSFSFLGFTIPIIFGIGRYSSRGNPIPGTGMTFDPELFGRIRLEGNPSQLTGLFEQQGIPLMGLGAHFVGGDLASMVIGMIDSLTNPSATSNETFEFPELDILSLLQAFLNSKVEILHYWKYLVDPDFMKASEWYLDPGFVDINATMPTLIWDRNTRIPGDRDGIPDEYPWYRFLMPVYNQDPTWVDYGPSSTSGRNPALLDFLGPNGPPGSGKWVEIADGDGIPDGIQHYWYDTPYAYVNVSVNRKDPWVNVNPYMWNNLNGSHPFGWYVYTVPGAGTIIWGDDPNEQVPLLQVAPNAGISSAAWDGTGIPSLYYVPAGTSPGIVGSATHYPIPQPNGQNIYPNIWNSFNITLNQTDYRFGYWDTEYDPILQKNVRFLETKPFYDLLSYAFYPQLLDLLDWVAPLIVDLILDIISPSGGAGAYKGEWGYDYYHLLQNSSVYSQFGYDPIQPLCPIGMLEWIWEGAGERWNGSQFVPNIEPFTIPDLQGALDWMADHGFTTEFLIKNLGKIFEMFAITPENGGAGSEAGLDLASSLASVFTVDSIVNIVNTMEEYFLKVVAQNTTTGEPDRMQATEIALRIMKDMTEILDIYPVKAIRGALNYIMPIMFAPSAGGGQGSSMNANELDLGTFLNESGLLDIIFKNASKLNDLKLKLSIHQTTIDLYLFGQLIEDVPLDFEFELDFATLFGGGDSGSGGKGASTNALNNLPISFPESGFPYIELSTFNGPFDITFNLFNTSFGGNKSPIRNTPVTIGEIWFNETTGVYIFNRTQSSQEFQAGLSGWTNFDANGIPRTYIRPNSLLRSNNSGMVRYSSFIESDEFGWVDSYIYIHVEKPNDYPNQEFYWWNVTGHPLQRSLAGNNPPYKARWVEDGSKMLVQSLNTLPEDVINIDNDSYWEIFARVEIDGYHMPVHEVVYVRVGSVMDVSIVNATGGVGPMQVQINASYVQSTQTWNIFAKTDRTKYIIQEELTPTGSTVTYPTISQVISGFHLETQGWNDDSLYDVKIDYVNLTGTLLNLYSWTLPKQIGAQRGFNVIYPSEPNAAFDWTPVSPDKTVTLTFSPTLGSGSTFRYGEIDIGAANFLNKTIRSVTLDLEVSKAPAVGTETTRRLSEDFLFTRPSPSRIHFMQSDYNAGEVVIKGSPNNLALKNATSAWVNYTLALDGNSFLNGIDWNIRMEEPGNGAIANVQIQYYNSTNSRWYTLFNRANVGRTYKPNNTGYVSPPYLDDFADQIGTLRNPHTGVVIGPIEDLYLTARNRTHEYSKAFESISQVKFAVRFTETSGFSQNGIGYTNGTANFNTSVWVSFRFYPFVSSWGLGAIEIPEGFVDDFTATITMYDPLRNLGALGTSNITKRPSVSMNYTYFGPLNTNMYIHQENLFARKVIIRLEAWDSLVRDHGIRGDILFKDNVTIGTVRLIPLDNLPIMNTTIEVVDLEARVYINITIPAKQTLRNYFLRLNITPGLGYEGRGYTSNYRFSVGTDVGGNTEAVSRIGAYPSKKVLNNSAFGFPISLQVGITDLEPFPSMFKLYYILTFEVSPEFLLNTTARERFYFTAAWEKADGSYELRSDKITLEPAKTIIIKYK